MPKQKTKSKVRIGWEIEFYVPKTVAPKNNRRPTAFIRNMIRKELRKMGYKVANGQMGSNVNVFYVRNDCSLAGVDNEKVKNCADIEIVTPPLPLQQARQVLSRLFAYVKQIGGITTEDCGLHANISFQSFSKQNMMTQACYFVPLFLRDTRILNAYGRGDNEYCQSVYKAIKRNVGTIAQRKTIYSILWELKGIYSFVADKDNKCVSVNLCHIEEHDDDPTVGYIEFRCIGNKNYHKKTTRVLQSVDQYILAMEQAIDASTNINLLCNEVEKLKGAAKRDRTKKTKQRH